MGLISRIGRNSFKVRALIFTIYAVLIIGSVTMIYPFWVMLSGAGKSGIDNNDASVIPPFLIDDDVLYRKTVESLFNEGMAATKSAYNIQFITFAELPVPQEVNRKYVDEWVNFITEKDFPFYYYMVGHSTNHNPVNGRAFKNVMVEKYDGDINAMNNGEGTEFIAWPNFVFRDVMFLSRYTAPNMGLPLMLHWYSFKPTLPIEDRVYVPLTGYFKMQYLMLSYTDDITKYNEKHGTNFQSYNEIWLSRNYPEDAGEVVRNDWEFFVRNLLSMLWIRIDEAATADYQVYLKSKYGAINELNRLYGEDYASFDEVPIGDTTALTGTAMIDARDFVKGWRNPVTEEDFQAKAKHLSISSIEFEFQDYLMEKYGTLEEANRVLETNFASLAEFFPPQHEYHYEKIIEKKGSWRWEFSTRNYGAVINYIFVHGRALINTVIYCTLAVLCALIFNPIAAYALSRFRPPSTYKVLLFLMLTMAFPGIVTQIPNFLLMRELNLLNTFGALVLPGLANGYQIFLLKGFFDSLPKELYESAQLDGAGEVRMFFQLTMNLSKPILAVVALGAFTGAYANFMMALLICQDRNMWTITPWLYQLQQGSTQGVIYASLIIAAIPTFFVFMFCQNIIMRGIVVPVEKYSTQTPSLIKKTQTPGEKNSPGVFL